MKECLVGKCMVICVEDMWIIEMESWMKIKKDYTENGKLLMRI